MNDNILPEDQMTPEARAELQKNEDLIAGFKPEDLKDPAKAEELAKALASAKTTVHQKRHYRDKYTEATKPKPAAPAAPVAPAAGAPAAPAPAADKKGIDPIVALTFKQDHPELDRDVANHVIDHAAAYGVTPEEALKNPIVAKFVQGKIDEKAVGDAGIPPKPKASTAPARRDWSTASQAEIDAERNRILGGAR